MMNLTDDVGVPIICLSIKSVNFHLLARIPHGWKRHRFKYSRMETLLAMFIESIEVRR